MPKNTYLNLNHEKQDKIYKTLIKFFKEKPVNDITVKEIVSELNIPRGSFYQYFDSIYEAYFYVLEQELVDIHQVFLNILRENDMNILTALNLFGEATADEIFTEKHYRLYRNRYLCFDDELEKQWRYYCNKNSICCQEMEPIFEREKNFFYKRGNTFSNTATI